MALNFEADSIVVGVVDRIVGTSVFIKLDPQIEGVINFSEVAPGRIRNIRDYIKIGQRIVVKILRVDPERRHIDLSLRRVSQKERKEALENEKREKELNTILKIVLKDEKKAAEIITKIKIEQTISEFFEKFSEGGIKESNLRSLDLNDQESKALFSFLKEKIKEKKAQIKVEFSLHTDAADGIEKIKKILTISEKNVLIKYLGSPNYSLSIEDKDYKEINKRVKSIFDQIAQKAKAEGALFEMKSQI
ncbi:MAG: S1 RNA-binding domain-containing protein [Candidatus Pacearchaeota archaeon]|nr:S1 RNA-binding domain-containing protein [Candidatus Pacearchaeota archaeon]